ncbi:MAG: YkgJ family cysteine cluster protein [Pyrinomonadaceae bacterium]
MCGLRAHGVRPGKSGRDGGWRMRGLLGLRLRTDCASCVNKCCSQPYDWVYLTARECSRLAAVSGRRVEEFVEERRDADTGDVFRALSLPCPFLDEKTGQCTVYEVRPMACRLFPFHVDPLTGDASLYPTGCGENLLFPAQDEEGWRLSDLREDVRRWVGELRDELVLRE